MAHGTIKRTGSEAVIGTWRAGAACLTVETKDPHLRRVADEILSTPLRIPLHPPEKFVPSGPESSAYEPPAKLRYLLLFVTEMEARGFTVEGSEED